MKNLIFVFFALCGVTVFGQSEGLFNNPEAAEAFFNGRVYEVPGYGTITFRLNKLATRNDAERRERDGSSDEMVDLIFDVAVKRKDARRKDKGDYMVDVVIYLSENGDPDMDPNKGYVMDFSLVRNIVYPIKGFPSQFFVFSDGDLYFQKYNYKQYSFEEYKKIILQQENRIKDVKIEYVRCNSLMKK
jgi:hypothetical protein